MLVTVDRKSSWQNVLTMNVSISYGGVTDPLVNRMALGLVVKLEKVSVFCVKTSTMQCYIIAVLGLLGTLLLEYRFALLILDFPAIQQK